MKTNLTAEVIHITPELAENYLKFNKRNRATNKPALAYLKKQMKSGLFLENGEAIVFDKYGVLKDGQHRLKAIVETGKSYHIPVVRGVEPKVMATYDTGKNRSAGDVLQLNGFKNSNYLATLITTIDKWTIRGAKSQYRRDNKKRDKITNQQVLDYCSQNYDWLLGLVQKSMNINQKIIGTKTLTPTEMSLVAYMIAGENPTDEVYNFIKTITGVIREPETAPDYIYIKMVNSKVNKEPINFYWKLGMIIKAWNYYTDGNPAVKYYKFAVTQDLPKIKKPI